MRISILWDNSETNGADKVVERSDIAETDTWHVEAMYADEKHWESDFSKIDDLVSPLELMQGTLNSPEDIKSFFEAETELDRLINTVYVYAHLRSDEDTGHNDNQGRLARIRAKATAVSSRLSWAMPEILGHSEKTLCAWADSEVLKHNRYTMTQIIRRKPHTLSDKEEALLAGAGEVFHAPSEAFSLLTNADMKFPDVEDGEGKKRELSQGRYVTFLIDTNRDVRRNAFEAMYDTYGGFRNTLAHTLSSTVKLHNYNAQIRNFPSALEASLHSDQVPVGVYEAMIDTTHSALPLFYKYVDLRRRLLGLEKLAIYDMYVPIVPEYKIEVSYAQAKEWIIEACAPLGKEYVRVLKSAFDNRWIDVYENRGKRSGAYSSGCYDSLPYILMNYQGMLDSVFTLAHELGHSMHSWLANQSQPPQYADYPIFIAEIPSTLNEGLLLHYLLEKTDDPKFRAYLLNHHCDSFKGTVFRQTMFAEFEKLIHEMDAKGLPLTPDLLCEAYSKMNREYYGDGVDCDERIGLEWSRIPHFYYNFYVYKYATSFCASQIFLQRVLEGGAPCERYLDLLRAGGSGDPLLLIEQAGVSLTSRKTLEEAFSTFGTTVEQLDRELGELG